MDIFSKESYFSDDYDYCIPFSRTKDGNIRDKINKLKKDITQLEEELNSSL